MFFVAQIEDHCSRQSVYRWRWCCQPYAPEVMSSIPDVVTAFFNPSRHTMALGSTQPLAEMSTGIFLWMKGLVAGALGRQPHRHQWPDCLGSLDVSQPCGLPRPVIEAGFTWCRPCNKCSPPVINIVRDKRWTAVRFSTRDQSQIKSQIKLPFVWTKACLTFTVRNILRYKRRGEREREREWRDRRWRGECWQTLNLRGGDG
jgi:hypothetical protein